MSVLDNAPGFYNPKVRTVQGANSKTFKRIELDTTLTVPELFEFHAKHSPEHPVFVWVDDDNEEHVLRFPEVYRGIRKAATISAGHYARMADYYAQAQQGKDASDPPVVGILATAGTRSAHQPSHLSLTVPADTISFYTLKVGLMYLGLAPFPISTRNSAIAVAHLVSKTGVRQMFVSADPAMQRLAHDAIEILAKDGRELELLPMPTFEDMYTAGDDEALVPMGKVSPDQTAIILHSSGEFQQAALGSHIRGDSPLPVHRIDRVPETDPVFGQELQEVGNVCLCVVMCCVLSASATNRVGALVVYGDFDFCGVRVAAQPNPMFRALCYISVGVDLTANAPRQMSWALSCSRGR